MYRVTSTGWRSRIKMQPSRHNCVIRCHTSITSDEDLSESNGYESLSFPKIVPGDKTGTETEDALPMERRKWPRRNRD